MKGGSTARLFGYSELHTELHRYAQSSVVVLQKHVYQGKKRHELRVHPHPDKQWRLCADSHPHPNPSCSHSVTATQAHRLRLLGKLLAECSLPSVSLQDSVCARFYSKDKNSPFPSLMRAVSGLAARGFILIIL